MAAGCFASEQKRQAEKIAALEAYQEKARARHHEKIAPTIQALVFRVEELERGHIPPRNPYRAPSQLPSWDDLDDSRVTNDPKKEPTK